MIDLNTSRPTDATKKILLLGESGSGKTSMLRTFPTPIFVMDFDRKGLEILAGLDGSLEVYDKWDDVQTDLKKLKEGTIQCETLAIDSMSFAADIVLSWAKAKNGNMGSRLNQEDWGRAIKEIKDTMAALRALPMHVVVTMHTQVDKDELLGGIVYQPSIYGRDLPGRIPSFVNDVWLAKNVTEVKGGNPETKYVVQVRPDTRWKQLKNTSKGKWQFDEVPNFKLMMEKLK